MLLKNFIICRNQDNSTLSFLNSHLYMVQHLENKHPIYLSTLNMQTGIIHDKKTIFDHVIIQQPLSNRYSFISQRLNNYYYSIPFSNQHNKSLFQLFQFKNKNWKEFEIKQVSNLDFNLNQFQILFKQKQNNVIHLFWWQHKQFTNIGDELNLHIIGHLSKKNICRTNIENTDILAIGSIINWALPRDRIYPVWGSGTLSPIRLTNELFKVTLLRGPLTHEAFISHKNKIPYGDPALLCNHIFPANKRQKYKWGLITHHSQYQKDWVQQILKNTPEILFIDLKNPNINDFIQQLTSCEKIASSSLHGLIIADSYHIPNIWLWDHNLHEGGKWKFFDYFAGIRRTEINSFNPNNFNNLNDININNLDLHYFNRIDKVKNLITEAFPL